MQTKKDYSCGVVPLFKNDNGEYEILLIHQISYRGKNDRFWTLPKGHPEEGEEIEESVRRELKEETGVTDVELEMDTAFTSQYSFMHEGVKIEKTVEYFIGYAQSRETQITQPQEVAELKWCSFEEAYKILSHTKTRIVLEEVLEYLRK